MLLEVISVIYAFILYNLNRNRAYFIILLLLCITVISEIIQMVPIIIWRFPNTVFGQFLNNELPKTSIFRGNIWISNIHSVLIFYCYLLFYKIVNDHKRVKRTLNVFIILYSVFVVIEIFDFKNILQSWLQPHMYAGVILTLLAIFLYLMTILKSDKILTFHKTLPFWITMGILFFNLVTMPIFIFAKQLNFSASVYVYILVISNYVMYGSFIIGFIINAREQRKLE